MVGRKLLLKLLPLAAVALSLILWSARSPRSEEHTSELQSPCNPVCRLLLAKTKREATEFRHNPRERKQRAASILLAIAGGISRCDRAYGATSTTTSNSIAICLRTVRMRCHTR